MSLSPAFRCRFYGRERMAGDLHGEKEAVWGYLTILTTVTGLSKWADHPSALSYCAAWISGNGCVPINNLMEDAATAEIARVQLWQWVKYGSKTVRLSLSHHVSTWISCHVYVPWSASTSPLPEHRCKILTSRTPTKPSPRPTSNQSSLKNRPKCQNCQASRRNTSRLRRNTCWRRSRLNGPRIS